MGIFRLIFTAVRDGGTDEVTGVQMMAERDGEAWKGHLRSPGEFVELMLASHIFSPVKADGLFKRIKKEGQIIEENVALTDEHLRLLELRKS